MLSIRPLQPLHYTTTVTTQEALHYTTTAKGIKFVITRWRVFKANVENLIASSVPESAQSSLPQSKVRIVEQELIAL